jgi:hypothetical protein
MCRPPKVVVGTEKDSFKVIFGNRDLCLNCTAASFTLSIASFHVKGFKLSSEQAVRQGVQFGQIYPFFLGTRVMWGRLPVYSSFVPEDKAVQIIRTAERKPR